MSAKVIPLRRTIPVTAKSCLKCRHVFVGMSNLYCGYWREEIFDEKIAAEDCAAYET